MGREGEVEDVTQVSEAAAEGFPVLLAGFDELWQLSLIHI